MNNSHTGSVTAIPLLGIIMYVLSVSSPAHAETTNCTAITSLPAVIASQGVYCLTGNLSTSMTSGFAIEIQTNNVTLDLNGFKLGGLGAGDGTAANGIYANQQKNITIKNGIIRGFFRGIRLDDVFPYTTSSGHVVKGILADQNTYIGIWVAGFGNTVSGNTVVDTGGSIHSVYAFGINVFGSGAKVIDNAVSTTTETDGAFGINITDADYSLVQNNTVTDTIPGTGSAVAIQIGGSTGVFLTNNKLANAESGLFFNTGSTGKYFNNLTFDVTTPFTGGTAVGNNNN